MRFLLTVLILLLFKSISLKSQNLSTEYSSAIEMFKKGNYATSASFLAELIVQSEFIYRQNSRDTLHAYISALYSKVLYENGDLDEAQVQSENTVLLMKERFGVGHFQYSTALLELIAVYLDKSMIDEAYYQLNKIEPILFRSKFYTQLMGLHLSAKGRLLHFSGNIQKAKKVYTDGLSAIEKRVGQKNEDYFSILYGLGDVYAHYQQIDSAELILNKCLTMAGSLYGKNHPKTCMVLSALQGIFSYQGEFEKAESCNLKILSVYANKLSSGIRHIIALRNMAIVKQQLHKYQEAQNYYFEVIELLIKKGNKDVQYAEINASLGVLFINMGRYEEAIEKLENALKLLSDLEGKEYPGYLIFEYFLAESLVELHDDRRAITILEGLLIRQNKVFGKESFRYADCQLLLGEAYSKSKIYDRAELLLSESLSKHLKHYGKGSKSYNAKLCKLAKHYYRVGDYYFSNRIYEGVIQNMSTENWKPIIKSEIFFDIALLYKAMGRTVKADSTFQLAINTSYNDLIGILEYSNEYEIKKYSQTLTDQINGYTEYLVSNINQHNYSKQFLYNTRLKTKALLLGQQIRLKDMMSTSNDSITIKLYSQWKNKKQYYARRISSMSSESFSLDSLKKEIDLIEKVLTKRSYFFERKQTNKKVTWRNIKEALEREEVAIEIIQYGKKDQYNSSRYAAMIIKFDSESPEIVNLTKEIDLEGEPLNNYQRRIHHHEIDESSYDYYWTSIEESIIGAKKVYLSKDGVYNLISIGALYNSSQNKYVMDDYDIHLISNTKEIVSDNVEKLDLEIDELTAVLFGNPTYKMSDESDFLGSINHSILVDRSLYVKNESMELKDFTPLIKSEKEVQEISNILRDYGWSTSVHLKQDALESKVKTVSKPTILHLATHGYFNPVVKEDDLIKKMLNSGLVFAGVNNNFRTQIEKCTDDGILTAYETTTMDLGNTELVVLSACESGLGDVSAGEGVYGLQRGLMVAGAKSVMMSLWKVNDAITQELMVTFYSYWMTMGDKRAAFRRAQNQIREKYPHPYYWGGFVMVGSNTILQPIKSNTISYVWFIAFIVVSLLLTNIVRLYFNTLRSSRA